MSKIKDIEKDIYVRQLKKWEQQRMYNVYLKKWRDYDLLCMILSTTGLVIQFMNYEYDTRSHFHKRDPKKYKYAMDDP